MCPLLTQFVRDWCPCNGNAWHEPVKFNLHESSLSGTSRQPHSYSGSQVILQNNSTLVLIFTKEIR
jgi:hypothetical protein